MKKTGLFRAYFLSQTHLLDLVGRLESGPNLFSSLVGPLPGSVEVYFLSGVIAALSLGWQERGVNVVWRVGGERS